MRRVAGFVPLLVVSGLLGLGLALPLWLAYERGQVYAVGSSLRSDEQGARALFLLLEELGERPRRVQRPVPSEPRGLLVSLAPLPAEHDALLLDWVRQGNVLLVAATPPGPAAHPTASPSPSPEPSPSASPSPRSTVREALGLDRPYVALLPALGLQEWSDIEPQIAQVPLASSLAPILPAFSDRTRQTWRRWPTDARVLIDGDSQPMLIEFSLGHGKVLALSDADWFSNAGLPRGARLDLALHLLRAPGLPILFDEYRHGLAEQPGLAYVLARYGLVPTAFAALGFLALLAWRTSPTEAPPHAGGSEQEPLRDSLLEVRAGLYARSLPVAEAAVLLEHQLRTALGERLALGAATWPTVRERLQQRHAELSGELTALLRELASLRASSSTPLQPLIEPARRAARLLAALAAHRAPAPSHEEPNR